MLKMTLFLIVLLKSLSWPSGAKAWQVSLGSKRKGTTLEWKSMPFHSPMHKKNDGRMIVSAKGRTGKGVPIRAPYCKGLKESGHFSGVACGEYHLPGTPN
jgi:hypothetical protein